MPRWCAAACEGHIGKFEDCVTEALYNVTLDGDHDAETGSVEWDVWAALLSDWTPGHPPREVAAGWVGIPPGSYVLMVNDQGFVWSRWYQVAAHAREHFDRIDADYAAWAESNEEV